MSCCERCGGLELEPGFVIHRMGCCTQTHSLTQPIVLEARIARFKPNRIVRALLDRTNYSLNDVAAWVQNGQADAYEWAQLLQLIGMSVAGFGDMNVPPELVAEADTHVRRLLDDAADE